MLINQKSPKKHSNILSGNIRWLSDEKEINISILQCLPISFCPRNSKLPEKIGGTSTSKKFNVGFMNCQSLKSRETLVISDGTWRFRVTLTGALV